MKHIEIAEDLHDLIKFYCWYHNIKLKEYIDGKLRAIPELQEFNKQRKRLRFS